MAEQSNLSILFAVDSTFPGLGGAEIQAVKLAHALRACGVNIVFVAPRLSDTQAIQEAYQGFELHRIVYPRIRLLGSALLMWRFHQFLRREAYRFDYVHVHVTNLLATAAVLSRKSTGLPVITKISGFFEFEGGVLDQRRRWSPLHRFIRLALRRIDCVQTISQQTRIKLEQAGFRPEQIRFIPNGIDTSVTLPPRVSTGVLTVGYCGRLREVKGVHVLIDGFARFVHQHPDSPARLMLAGDGEARAGLERQVQTLGLTGCVEFLGRVEDTSGFLAQLDIYVQPSFAEGLPNSVIEAMLAERVVVATDIGGNQDLVTHEHTGLLFPAGDAQALATHLARCAADLGRVQPLAAAGRQKIVQQYGFDGVCRELMDVYCG